MKFEVDMRTFIPNNKVNIFISGWSGKPQISLFRGLSSLVPHQGFALDPLGGLEWPARPPVVVFRIFRKIHFLPWS
jgi:hypothetical protein